MYEEAKRIARFSHTNIHSFRGTRYSRYMEKNGMLPATPRQIEAEKFIREEAERSMVRGERDFPHFVIADVVSLCDPTIDFRCRFFYVIMKTFSWSSSDIFPSVSLLAKRAGICFASASKYINTLIDAGLVCRYQKHGRNFYRLVDLPERYYYQDGRIKEDVLERMKDMGFNFEVRCVERMNKEEESLSRGFCEDDDYSEEEASGKEDVVVDDVSDDDLGPALVDERFEGVMGVVQKRDSERQILQAKKKRKTSAAVVDIREKGKQFRREDQKRQRKEATGSELTIKDVKEAWDIACLHKFPGVDSLCSPWDLKQVKLAKHICAKYKIDNVVSVIPKLIADWDKYAERFRIKGYPSIEVVCAKSSQLFPEVEGGSRGYTEPVKSKYKAADCTGDDVKTAWKRMFKVRFNGEYNGGRWGDKESNCARSIARKVSKAGAEKIIIDLMVNWDKYCDRFGFKRTPGIGLLSTHMGMMQNLLDTGKLFMDQDGDEAEIRKRIKVSLDEHKTRDVVVEAKNKPLF